MPKKPIARIALFMTALSLAACAHSTPSQPVAKEKAAMTTELQPGLTAEQGLLRLLELIRTNRSIAEFTPQRLEQAFGAPVTSWRQPRHGYGFGVPLPSNWVIGVVMDNPNEAAGAPTRFEFSFNPSPSGASPAMTEMCHLDFDRFTAELEAMGFSRESVYDSPPQLMPNQPRLPHGRHIYDGFWRTDQTGLRVGVYPEGESDQKAGHLCVKQVLIY